MPRYKIWIEFEGTRYCGWQSQPEDPTIQDEVEAALGRILREDVDVYGQGRTDSGVHAEGQTAHFDYEGEIDIHRVQYGINSVLSEDIAIWRMEQVDEEFHARFDAVARQYRYQIVQRPRPLYRKTAWLVRKPLDLEGMQQCAEGIRGEHDFRGFARLEEGQETARCEVLESGWEQGDGALLMYRVRANRFVRHLVRRLVGSMVKVGLGKWEADAFKGLLEQPGDSDKKGYSAPPQGLILEKVIYP